jgi:hypothetical protein
MLRRTGSLSAGTRYSFQLCLITASVLMDYYSSFTASSTNEVLPTLWAAGIHLTSVLKRRHSLNIQCPLRDKPFYGPLTVTSM